MTTKLNLLNNLPAWNEAYFFQSLKASTEK